MRRISYGYRFAARDVLKYVVILVLVALWTMDREATHAAKQQEKCPKGKQYSHQHRNCIRAADWI